MSIITYEEQIRGRLLYLNKAKTLEKQVLAYQGLQKHLSDYQIIKIIGFEENAIVKYEDLRKKYRRLGKMDLKIASIAIVNQAILLTRNLSDFG